MRILTEIREAMGISLSALRANKLRSGLATLGIVIGIVTVTLMATAIQGLNKAFLKSISVLGTDVIYVQRFGWFIDSHAEWMKAAQRRPITPAQVKQLEKELSLARAVAPLSDSRASVKYKNRSASSVTVLGTTEQFAITTGTIVAEGRYFSAAEAAAGRPVCVIGWDVATNLFINETALGKQLKVGDASLEVVGVLEKQGALFGQSLDNQVVVPLMEFMSSFRSFPDVEIHIKAVSVEKLEEMKEEVRGALRRIRRVPPGVDDDFTINQQETLIETFNRVGGTIASVGIGITALSLFVGGIGIMNIMFVSVAERTREIGIRKAIGAKRRTILIQFLTEAAVICLFGGLLALSIAYPLTLVVRKFLPASMSLSIVGIALLVSLVTGVLSGFFPAWRAARMNPVDALRNE
ncbi:MAG: ABC transporter permease [Verrucomicrobiota bacterium]|nr:ABC transporter permease [Verrucomicrobiota bacterium]